MILGHRLSRLNTRSLLFTLLQNPRPSCLRHTSKQIQTNPSRTFAGLLARRPQKLTSTVVDSNTSSSADGQFVVLSDEQQRVLDLVLDGQSVFFTGSAGTGKSVLLREIIRRLREEGNIVEVTASTGIAAVNVGGKTLHAFAGVGLGKLDTDDLIDRVRWSPKTRARWRTAEVLVIDEISMVDAKWFDVLAKIGKEVRHGTKPFGGLQLVICGDFFQLPPVPDRLSDGTSSSVSYAFEAKCWNDVVPNTIRLTKVFRQKDPMLIDLLNDMRQGVVSEESQRLLRGLSREIKHKGGTRPVELFPHRARAEAANNRQMLQLPGETIRFTAIDKAGVDTEGRRVKLDNMTDMLDRMIAPTIELRLKAQVMCVKNIPDTDIVNGSVGEIESFMTPRQAREDSRIRFIPHPRSKNATKNPNLRRTRKHEGKIWPVVRYDNEERILMTPVVFEQENGKGEMEVRREQVPLILAWALTVHKAQGQTLSRVKIDLANSFAHGQVYVALSRCTSLEGLQVLNFSHKAVFADPSVLKWSENLSVPDKKQPDV